MAKEEFKKALVLFDIHYPEHQKKHLELIYHLAKTENFDELIFGGDQLDLAEVSSWNKGKPLLVEGMRLKETYDNFLKDVLIPMEEAVGKKCKKVWINGNHEFRLNRYLEQHPEMIGLSEPEVYLELKKRNYEIVPYNQYYKLGKLYITHGMFANEYHAAKTVKKHFRNIMTGHCHTLQEFTVDSPVESNNYRMGFSVPCLCNLNPYFRKNRPSSWMNGFAIVYVLNSGDFYPYIILISHNKFIFNGRIWQ